MRGFPKHLNTKQDFINLMRSHPEETRKELKKLLSNRMVWFTKETLDSEKDGVENETMRVIAVEDEGGMTILQQELREDPNARLFRLGFTVKEIESMMGGIKDVR